MNWKQAVILITILTVNATTHAQDPVDGMAINLPVVGRLFGAGGTLFRTSVDVSNNTQGATRVDYYFDGRDNAGENVSATGSITNAGLVNLGAGNLQGRTNVHFEDFVQSLVEAGAITAVARDRGVVGSLLLVFDDFTRPGQAGLTGRFWNELGGGTVGVSIAGREITADEPRRIIGVVHDTRGGPGAQLYANLFINNTGLALDGSPGGVVVVELRAISATTGQPVGRTAAIAIQPGHTVAFGDAANQLQVPARQPVLVIATVVQGDATIHGVISTIDAVTRDGAVVYMSKAD